MTEAFARPDLERTDRAWGFAVSSESAGSCS